MYIIKKATMVDAELIRIVIEQIWLQSPLTREKKSALFKELEQTHSVKRIAHNIQTNQLEYLIVANEMSVIAFAAFSWDPLNPSQLNIRQLYDLGVRQAGDYLLELISRIEVTALGAGAELIRVSLNNKGNLELFESMGFLPFEFRRSPDHEERNRALEMVKYLTYPSH